MTIFDVVDYIFRNVPLGDKEHDVRKNSRITSYLLNRFISMKQSTISGLNKIQLYSATLNKVEYIKLLTICFGITGRKKQFHRYVSGQKEFYCPKCGLFHFGDKRTKNCPKCKSKLKVIPTKEILEWLARYFNCSTSQAKSYRKILTEKHLFEILRKFGHPTDGILKGMKIKKKSLKNWSK